MTSPPLEEKLARPLLDALKRTIRMFAIAAGCCLDNGLSVALLRLVRSVHNRRMCRNMNLLSDAFVPAAAVAPEIPSSRNRSQNVLWRDADLLTDRGIVFFETQFRAASTQPSCKFHFIFPCPRIRKTKTYSKAGLGINGKLLRAAVVPDQFPSVHEP